MGDLGGDGFLDPIDADKSNQTDAAREAGQLGFDATIAGILEQNRQYDETAGRLQPFVDAGLSRLGDVTQAGTLSGLDQRYGDIGNSDIFSSLVNERMGGVQQQLAAGGLTRSGTALQQAADIPQDVQLALEDLLYDRQGTSLSSGQNAAAGLGAFGSDRANSITELLGRGADAQANAALQQGNISAQRTQNTAAGGAALLALFSDPRLKENMQPIGKIRDLTLYQWDWREGVTDIIGKQNCIGYNADEVAEKYPDKVVEIGSYKAVKYSELNAQLMDEIQRAA